jgi:hypothetical protein
VLIEERRDFAKNSLTHTCLIHFNRRIVCSSKKLTRFPEETEDSLVIKQSSLPFKPPIPDASCPCVIPALVMVSEMNQTTVKVEFGRIVTTKISRPTTMAPLPALLSLPSSCGGSSSSVNSSTSFDEDASSLETNSTCSSQPSQQHEEHETSRKKTARRNSNNSNKHHHQSFATLRLSYLLTIFVIMLADGLQGTIQQKNSRFEKALILDVAQTVV